MGKLFAAKKQYRRFKIKTVDIIEYMRRRQTEPRYYRVPDGYYSKKGKVDEQVEKLEKTNMNINQRFSVFQLLLQFYISINDEKKAKKLQKRGEIGFFENIKRGWNVLFRAVLS